jgi:hypothetical protein
MQAREVHAHEIHAREMHAREMDVRDLLARSQSSRRCSSHGLRISRGSTPLRARSPHGAAILMASRLGES